MRPAGAPPAPPPSQGDATGDPAAARGAGAGSAHAELGLFTVNLVLLLGLGVLVSGWFLFYTGIFPVIGGLLGLGGLFAWIAFVSGLLAKARKEQMQEVFERRVLMSRRTPWGVAAVAAALVASFGFFGSVEVSAVRDGAGRTVKIYPSGAPPGGGSAPSAGPRSAPQRELFLPARGSQRLTLPTRWLGSRHYHIEVSGLPSLPLEVRAWRRQPVVVPDSFLSQQVLLVWPSGPVANSLLVQHDGRARLVVRARRGNGGPIVGEQALASYEGNAVWIGYGGDFALPDWLLERWRREVARGEASEAAVTHWRRPLFVDGLDLMAGDQVEVRIYSETETREPLVAETITVRAVRRLSDLPQTEVLDDV